MPTPSMSPPKAAMSCSQSEVVTAEYLMLMARYNAEMNRRFIAAASRLSDGQRRADRGAFFGSIHGTFNHLLWADRVWLWRLVGAEAPSHAREDSANFVRHWDDLVALRVQTDKEICDWSKATTPEDLRARVTWFAGTPSNFLSPRALQVVHMFNHQIHHRGQIHALLTGFGEDTAETSVWVLATPGFTECEC